MAISAQRPFGVVTGASSGIGFELARQFVDNGFDVLIAAEDSDIITAAAALRSSGAEVIPLQVDLAAPEGVDILWAEINQQGRPVEAIAINAGIGVGGPFAETSIEDETRMIALNVTSTTHLAKHVVQHMQRRGRGRILFTASIVSVMPSPFQAVYAATKAYVLSLSDALRNELKDTEITVTALMPGATDTEFFARADLLDTKVGQAEKDDPADVARDGFKAMMDGKGHVVAHSFMNRLQGILGEILPEDVKTAMLRRETEPGSAKH
jgi:short-subunit dehydrogenase